MVSLASNDAQTVKKTFDIYTIGEENGKEVPDTLDRWQVSHRTQVLPSECVLSAYQSTTANPK